MYSAMRGTVRVQRGLYRQADVRNGPTLVPMELRAGTVEGRYTPSAGRGLAALSQAVPSREADLLCKELGVLPHSRSAHFRTGVAMGTPWAELPEERAAAELGAIEIPEALVAEIAAIRAKRPDLRLVALSDGAPEMQSIVDDATAGYEVSARMTDFYHLSEHLADALKDTDR